MRCLLQGLPEAGHQNVVEGNVQHQEEIESKQAAMAALADMHVHLVSETSLRLPSG